MSIFFYFTTTLVSTMRTMESISINTHSFHSCIGEPVLTFTTSQMPNSFFNGFEHYFLFILKQPSGECIAEISSSHICGFISKINSTSSSSSSWVIQTASSYARTLISPWVPVSSITVMQTSSCSNSTVYIKIFIHQCWSG